MFIATKIWFEPETFLPVVWDGYEFDGVIATQCKKGRETAEQNAQIGQAQAKQQNANSQSQYNTANKLEGEEVASTAPGSLSPAATAQLAGDTANIDRVYSGMRKTAFATLGQRGMENAPSGMAVAANNGLDVGQEGSETGAYRNAQVQTEAQRQHAMGTAASLSGQQGQLGNANLNSSEKAAVDRNQMGSTAGDIMGGIAAAAPIIAAPFTGGASLMAMAGQPNQRMWGKLGQGSGVGSYGPSTGAGSGTEYS